MAYATSYELTGRIAGDRIVAFKGRRADGVTVLLHQLTPGFDHSEVLKLAVAYMLRYPLASGGRIQDLVEIDGVTCLVTADDPDCVELPGWLSMEVGHREVGHTGIPEAEITAEQPPASPARPAAPQVISPGGFTPFFGPIQSTSGTFAPAPASKPLLTSSHPKPVVPFTAITGSLPMAERAQEPAPKTVILPRAVVQEPQASAAAAQSPAPVSSVGASPILASPPPEATPAPAVGTTYLIAQPKAGLPKMLAFTVLGFVVVAALFFIAMAVVRGMK